MCFFHLGHSQISCKWWLRDYPMGVTQKSRHLNISWTNILLPHDTITSCPSHYHRFSVFIDSMGIGEQMMERKATDCDHLILLCPKVHGSNLPRLGCWDSLHLSIIINHVWRLGPSLPWTKWVFPPFDFFFENPSTIWLVSPSRHIKGEAAVTYATSNRDQSKVTSSYYFSSSPLFSPACLSIVNPEFLASLCLVSL